MECSICFEKLTTKTTLDCGHSFHEDCIYKWSIRENNCPMCRAEFKFYGKDYDKWFQNKVSKLDTITDIEERIVFIVNIVDTVIECSKNHGPLEDKSFYKELICRLKEQEYAFKVSFWDWILSKIGPEKTLVEYGWYDRALKNLSSF